MNPHKAPSPIIHVKLGMRGYYKITATNVHTGKKRVLANWFRNLVTDAGLDMIGNAGGYLSSCSVGSGNTAPAFSDTALVALVATTTTIQSTTAGVQSTPPYFGARTSTFRFAQGAAAGNLAEVGIGDGTTLFSRALILDGGGSPTTITVLGDEFLDVTYQLQLVSPTADVTGSIVINAVSYNYTVRAANANGSQWEPASGGDRGGFFAPGSGISAYDGAIQSVIQLPTGDSAGCTSLTNGSYSNGSHQIDAIAEWDLNTANWVNPPDFGTGVSAFSMNMGQSGAAFGQMQCGLDVPIPKDNTKVLSMTFRCSWARV